MHSTHTPGISPVCEDHPLLFFFNFGGIFFILVFSKRTFFNAKFRIDRKENSNLFSNLFNVNRNKSVYLDLIGPTINDVCRLVAEFLIVYS